MFRHQQNASMNESGLGSFYAYRNTFNDDNVWVEVPKNGSDSHIVVYIHSVANVLLPVTFHNITDPYNMEPTPEPEYHAASIPIVVPRLEERTADNFFHMPFDDAPGLEALSAAATSNFEYIRPMSATVQSPGEGSISQSSNNLNFILNPTAPERSMSMCSPT